MKFRGELKTAFPWKKEKKEEKVKEEVYLVYVYIYNSGQRISGISSISGLKVEKKELPVYCNSL